MPNTIKTTEFTSSGFNEGRRPIRSYSTFTRAKVPEGKRGRGSAAFLLVRLGLCAAAFCAVLGLKLAGNGEALAVMGEVNEGKQESGSNLGKLKFVELPSIIDVFAPSDSPVMPVNALDIRLTDEGESLAVVTAVGAEVVCPADGRVKAVGEDPELGKYVSVAVDGDIEFTIYGMGEIGVEEGQPVKQRQKLGNALGASVTIRAWRSGRPIDLKGFFGYSMK